MFLSTKILLIVEKMILRAEARFFSAVWDGDMYSKTDFAFYPALTLHPKYYYNISKRAENGKNTKNNAANYFGLQVRYIPNWFAISNTKGLRLSNQINFNFRRNLRTNFNYEFKIGLGYGTTFGTDYNTSGAILDLSIKVGYDF